MASKIDSEAQQRKRWKDKFTEEQKFLDTANKDLNLFKTEVFELRVRTQQSDRIL